MSTAPPRPAAPVVQLHLDGGPGADRAGSMVELLETALAPVHITLSDESHKHTAGPGAGTHWSVTVVSGAFAGRRAVQRHQAVYRALASHLSSGVHALAIEALTPEEAAGRSDLRLATPDCLGGGKHG